MKIYLTSDLHLEFGDCIIKNEHDVDVLILGGDIMISQDLHDHPQADYTPMTEQLYKNMGSRQAKAYDFRNFLERCSLEFPHVIYVAGNHEFYHGKWPVGLQYLRDECAKFSNVYFMENDSRTIDDVTFIGCTLWTDMNKFDPLTLHAVSDMMNDFQVVRHSDKGYRKLRPADVAQAHRASIDYIGAVVSEQHDRKFVVVGHHAPSTLSIHSTYRNDRLMNGAYMSDLSNFILDHPQIKLWTHGHTHHNFDYMIGSTRVVCNPRGYVGYEAQADTWKPQLIEV